MWAKRAEQLRDLHLSVDLEPGRCLDAADYLARYASRYGIRADLELRRARSGWAYDKHFVLCHADRGATKPRWVMQLSLSPAIEHETRVTLGIHTYRRFGRGVEAGRAAQGYRQLFADALRLAAAPRDRGAGNVIALRPYADLPPVASA
jgi:hypothetical protein